jgi:hypothetical protein
MDVARTLTFNKKKNAVVSLRTGDQLSPTHGNVSPSLE